MTNLYCISGLGADHRVFQKLRIPGATLHPVPWPYFDKHDELACYAQKVAAQIPNGPNDAILGLSFGGMLASEIARMRPAQQVFIVSSLKSSFELPPMGRFLQFVAKHRLRPLLNRFGCHTEEERALLRSILEDTDSHFARCAFKAIVEWRSTTPVPDNIVHIHGTADQMIPPDNLKPTHWIEGGEHIMIYSRADEVSALIAQHLT
jgi:pimeloyl-ACP methyl ester carboxylesterase